MKQNRKIIKGIILAALLGVIAYGIYRAIEVEYFNQVITMIDKDIPPLIFILLMLFLPAVGFPMSVFLVIIGIKFGLLWAFVIWAFTVPVHTVIGYYLSNALRRPMVNLLTGKMGYSIPEIPERHEALFSFVFLAVPGIPYAGKNYLLPLAGVKFRYCVIMNTISQILLGIPFIVLGKSASDMNPTYFLIAAGFFVTGLIIIWWIRKRYGDRFL